MTPLPPQPTDMLKVRMQAYRATYGPTATAPRLRELFRQALQEGGVRGLWRGVGPNVTRNAVVNAGEIASYDTFKAFLQRNCLCRW